MRGESREAPTDRAIVELARRQHGVVGLAQLRALGLGDDAIDWQVRKQRLHRVHRGVYVVGYPNLTRNGHFMAAVLACGDQSALSHFSAAVLWGMLNSGGKVHVTAPSCRKRQGLIIHRGDLAGEIAKRAGIPVTKPA
jgi:predicted transcriptional regulator of viral defense system